MPFTPFGPAGKCFAINLFNFSNACLLSSLSDENKPFSSSATIDSSASSNSLNVSKVSIVLPRASSTASGLVFVCTIIPLYLLASGSTSATIPAFASSCWISSASFSVTGLSGSKSPATSYLKVLDSVPP